MIQFKTDMIKERISSTTTFNPQLHMAHINRAYSNHIEKFFPEEKYEELADELETTLPEEATSEQLAERKKKEKLFSLFYDALANLGYYYTIPHLEVTVTSGGIVSIKTADREKADPRQIIRLEKSFSESGLENLDKLIAFLRSNSTLFSWFQEAVSAGASAPKLIKSMEIFQSVVDINSSNLVFEQLKPVIAHIERLELKGLLGDKMAQIIPDLPQDSPLRELKENAICYGALRAMAKGLRMKDVGMNEKGLYQIYIENRDYGKQPAAMPVVTEKINIINELAGQYRQNIEDLIDPPEESDGTSGLNKEDSGFFHTWT